MVLSRVLMLLLGLTVSAFCANLLFFLKSTLHWPSGTEDFGHFGISFLELLILFEQWAGHRLLSEKVTRSHERAHRHISISSVPVSEGIEIRQGCRFISSLIPALGKLPGGIGKLLPCGMGTHMSRLRHLGWAQCSHGLTSRPPESCHHQCLQVVRGVLGYPQGAAMGFVTAQGFFPRIFLTGIYPGWADLLELVRGLLLPLIISWVVGVTLVNGSG